MLYVSLNSERNGIKTMDYPQLKSEVIVSYHHQFYPEHKLSFTFEYERIDNFGYILNSQSKSILLWLSYEYLFTNN